jgi:hypothetical protein
VGDDRLDHLIDRVGIRAAEVLVGDEAASTGEGRQPQRTHHGHREGAGRLRVGPQLLVVRREEAISIAHGGHDAGSASPPQSDSRCPALDLVASRGPGRSVRLIDQTRRATRCAVRAGRIERPLGGAGNPYEGYFFLPAY